MATSHAALRLFPCYYHLHPKAADPILNICLVNGRVAREFVDFAKFAFILLLLIHSRHGVGNNV